MIPRTARSLGLLAIAITLGGVASSGCTPVVPPLTAPPVTAPNASHPAVLVRAEEAFLRAFAATDPRLLSRIGISAGLSPSEQDLDELGTRLATKRPGEHTDVRGLVGASLDPFALAARKSEGKLAYERFVEASHGAASPEADLARRFFLAERARATLEEDLTAYGGTLLLASTANLRDADSADAISARDAWLAERLGDVDDAFAAKKTSPSHRRELADALDPIERLLLGEPGAPGAAQVRFPRAFAVLAKLRETTGEARMMSEGALPEVAPSDLTIPLAVLGEERRPDEIAKTLTEAETALAAKAKEALATLSDRDADRARLAAGKRLALRAPCKQSVPGSLLRSLPASPEREAGCLAVHGLVEAKTAQEVAEAWVLLHDRTAVALWSITFHGLASTLAVARGKATMLSLAEEPTKSALLRKAALLPGFALGPGLVAALVVRGGKADSAHASRVAAFGDGDVSLMRGYVEKAGP